MLKTLYRFVADAIQKFIPGSDYFELLRGLEGKWVRIWTSASQIYYVGRLAVKNDCVVLRDSSNIIILFRYPEISSVIELCSEEIVELEREFANEMVEKAFEDSALRST